MAKNGERQAPKAPGTRRVQTITTEDVPTGNGHAPPDEGEFDPEGDYGEPPSALEVLLDDLGGDASATLTAFRVDPSSPGGRRFCGALTPGIRDTLTILTELQEKYGGGNFIVQVREPGGTFSKRVVVSVDAPKTAPAPAPLQSEQLAGAISAALAPMAAVIAKMESRPAFDLRTLAVNAIPLIPVLQQIRSLFAPAAPAQDFLSSLKQMKELRDLMGDAGMTDREPDTFDRMVTMFDKFGKPMIDAMAAAQNRNVRPPQPPKAGMPAFMRQQGIVRANVGIPVAATGIAPLPEELIAFLPQIVQMAKLGTLPEEAAELMLEMIPDERVEDVANALESGGLVDTLAAMPEFDGMRPWLNAVAKAFLSGLDSGEPGSPEGDESEDVPDNAQTAPAGHTDGDS